MNNVVTFYRLFSEAPPPIGASSTLGGTLPHRAVQYCDPLTMATGYGWYLRVPVDFDLLFDGRGFLFSLDHGETWSPLTSAQIPGFETEHKRDAPDDSNFLPPFLEALPEKGMVQIWTGYTATTRKNWALLIGGVSNQFKSSDYDCLEGVIETDWWTGPIFSNLIFRSRNRPVQFRRGEPLFQVRPIFKPAYSAQMKQAAQFILDKDKIPTETWDAFATAVTRDGRYSESPGWYAKCARQMRRKD